MNRDKQKIISDICPFYKEYGTCDQCNTALAIDDEPCYWECMANAIINNDYRKASDVVTEVLEILSELKENYLADDDVREACAISYAEIKIVALKQKYEKKG